MWNQYCCMVKMWGNGIAFDEIDEFTCVDHLMVHFFNLHIKRSADFKVNWSLTSFCFCWSIPAARKHSVYSWIENCSSSLMTDIVFATQFGLVVNVTEFNFHSWMMGAINGARTIGTWNKKYAQEVCQECTLA